MNRHLRDVTGMLVAPVATLRALAAQQRPAIWSPLALWLGALVLVEAKVLLRLAYLLSDGGLVMLRRAREALWEPAQTDVFVLLGTAAAAALAARLLARGRVAPAAAAAAATWLLVPLIALKALGGALSGFGLELWWLPHVAVDAPAGLVVDRQISWVRFAIKCVVAYGPSLGIALAWARTFRGDAAAAAAELSPTRRRLGLGLAALCALTLAAGAATGVVTHLARIRPVLPGDQLPELALRRIDELGVDNSRIKLERLRGKVVVLDFWASWCNPCRRSIPELSALSGELRDRGLVVVGVNREPEAPARAKAAIAQLKPAFDNVIDDRNYGERIGLTTLPTSFVLDKQGVLRHLHIGYTEIAVVRAEVEALLAE